MKKSTKIILNKEKYLKCKNAQKVKKRGSSHSEVTGKSFKDDVKALHVSLDNHGLNWLS